MHISSPSNPKFRFLLSLEKSRVRRTEQLTSVEGLKEIEMALEGGMAFRALFFKPGSDHSTLFKRINSKFPDLELYEITDDLYAKTAYRESSGGMIALVQTRENKLSGLRLPENPLILLISGVEKPGNLGAMLRTADAAAADAVICCDLPGDLYNPNTIRASLGTVFTVPLALAGSAEVMQWLRQNHITTYCSNLHRADNYFGYHYTGPSAIVMGTESTGISKEWMDFADHNVKIPMLGKIDSMNVSVAAAIMLYEARRQRMAAANQ